MSTENGDEKTCYMYSPSAAGAEPSPKDSGHLGRRPSLNPAWSISPGSIFLEDSESVRQHTFLLLLHASSFSFEFCFRVRFGSMCRSRRAHVFLWFFSTLHVGTCTQHDDTFHWLNKRNTNQPADWKMLTKKIQQEEQSVQEELTLFPSSPAAFVSHFATSVTARPLWEHTKLVHICTQRPRSKHSRSWLELRLPLRSTCNAIHPKSPAWCSWKTTELHPSRVVWLYCCSTLARSIIEWHRRSSGLRLRPSLSPALKGKYY